MKINAFYNNRIKSWKIGKQPKRIHKINSFIDKYNWEGINWPSVKDDFKKIDKNNLTIALNVLYGMDKMLGIKYFKVGTIVIKYMVYLRKLP